MFFEGVNFNDEVVKKMSQEEFESRHIEHFWKDRDISTRKKMLGEVYDLITKPAKTSKKKVEQ